MNWRVNQRSECDSWAWNHSTNNAKTGFIPIPSGISARQHWQPQRIVLGREYVFNINRARKPFHFYNILLNDISIFFPSFFLKSPLFSQVFFDSSDYFWPIRFAYNSSFGVGCLVVNAEEQQEQWTMCVLCNSVWICLSFHMKCFAPPFRFSTVLFCLENTDDDDHLPHIQRIVSFVRSLALAIPHPDLSI